MLRLSSCWFLLAFALVVVPAGVDVVAAVPSAETLLPETTEGFVAVGSFDTLRDAWNKTQLGQLMNDPVMKPFMDSFQEQMQEKWSKSHRQLGISWKDLDGVPTGEISLSMIRPSEKEVALAITADVTGNLDKANELLAKIERNLTEQKAVRSQRQIHGAKVVVFDIPKYEDNPPRQMVYCVQDDLLIASDSVSIVEGMLARRADPQGSNLAKLGAFASITARCQKAAGELAPHIRWFVDPFGYADSMRVLEAEQQPRRKGQDMLKILKNQGFTAIEGVGGFVNFYVTGYEMLHRTFIYAPGNKSGDRFELAARMLDLPNGGNFLPPDWVPRDVASYAALNLNTSNAFEMSKTLVNEVVGDEVFDDVIESIRSDENGPMIDVRKDLIALLGNRVTIISDMQVPITPKSERMVFAVETNDPEKLAVTIRKQMETDEDAHERMIAGHVVWEIVDQQSELPMVTIETNAEFGFGDSGAPAQEEEPEEEEKPLLPNSAVTVAHGQLLVATHIDILAKVLAEESVRGTLGTSSDFLRVEAELEKLQLPEQSARMFVRTDDAYRGVYELLKTGRMPESESMLGKLLNAMLGEGKEGVLRTQRIDGSKLPDYDLVRRYLGPAGMTATTESDGWMLTGFTLVKEPQPTAAEQPQETTAQAK
ncbi:MAG: hypothetical protein AB7O59_05165 [Pirellulales bacterium]